MTQNTIQSIVGQQPDRKEKVEVAASYLKSFVHGISICEHDEEANKGGATEPHVSHMLAGRLSSHPMKWSKSTLERFAPILVSDDSISFDNNQNDKFGFFFPYNIFTPTFRLHVS